MRTTKQIPVPRGNLGGFVQSLDLVRRRLQEKEVVFIFPEMTRCQPGFQGVNSFSVAPFHAAFQEKKPILPVIMKGTDDVWPRGIFGVTWRRPVSLRTLPLVDSQKFASAEELKIEVKRQIESALT